MKVIDRNRYYLPGTHNRFLHLATVHHGVREFICMSDLQTNKTYIEEITGGHLEFIQDDSLAQGLADFLTMERVLDLSNPLLPDKEWFNKKS